MLMLLLLPLQLPAGGLPVAAVTATADAASSGAAGAAVAAVAANFADAAAAAVVPLWLSALLCLLQTRRSYSSECLVQLEAMAKLEGLQQQAMLYFDPCL